MIWKEKMHFMFFEEKISQGKMDTIYIMKKIR